MSEVVESPEGSCSNPDCRVSETAQCLEGLELDACPHFGPASEARSPEEESRRPTICGERGLNPAAYRYSAELRGSIEGFEE